MAESSRRCWSDLACGRGFSRSCSERRHRRRRSRRRRRRRRRLWRRRRYRDGDRTGRGCSCWRSSSWSRRRLWLRTAWSRRMRQSEERWRRREAFSGEREKWIVALLQWMCEEVINIRERKEREEVWWGDRDV